MVNLLCTCTYCKLPYLQFLCTVYNSCGYLDIVEELAQQSMQAAVEEVKSLPDYPTKGEVNVECLYENYFYSNFLFTVFSVLLLMPGMTLLQMPITLLFHA